MTVGERIKKIREEKNISQTELAKATNISKQNLYKYENNIITNIPSDKIEDIANCLKISPSYLMGWTQGETILKYEYDSDDIKEELSNQEIAIISHYRKADTDTRLQVLADLSVLLTAVPVGENMYQKLTKEQRMMIQSFLSTTNGKVDILKKYMDLNDDKKIELIDFLDFLLNKQEVHTQTAVRAARSDTDKPIEVVELSEDKFANAPPQKY